MVKCVLTNIFWIHLGLLYTKHSHISIQSPTPVQPPHNNTSMCDVWREKKKNPISAPPNRKTAVSAPFHLYTIVCMGVSLFARASRVCSSIIFGLAPGAAGYSCRWSPKTEYSASVILRIILLNWLIVCKQSNNGRSWTGLRSADDHAGSVFCDLPEKPPPRHHHRHACELISLVSFRSS